MCPDDITTPWQFLYVNCHVSYGWHFVSLLSFNTKSVWGVIFWPRASPRGPKSYYVLVVVEVVQTIYFFWHILLDFVMFWYNLTFWTYLDVFLGAFRRFWTHLDAFWRFWTFLDILDILDKWNILVCSWSDPNWNNLVFCFYKHLS